MSVTIVIGLMLLLNTLKIIWVILCGTKLSKNVKRFCILLLRLLVFTCIFIAILRIYGCREFVAYALPFFGNISSHLIAHESTLVDNHQHINSPYFRWNVTGSVITRQHITPSNKNCATFHLNASGKKTVVGRANEWTSRYVAGIVFERLAVRERSRIHCEMLIFSASG